MRQALTAGCAGAAVIFIAGVIFGWQYALLLGLCLIFMVILFGRK